jgi:tetratricopeptide (TPR) repeat protein
MPRRYWIATLSVWPGLAQIWTGQELLGLMLGAGFAAVTSSAILARLLWTELAPPAGADFLSALAVTIWVCTLGYTVWWIWRCHPARYKTDIDAVLRSALDASLRREFSSARKQLERILALDETDVDAWMHLGTVHLHMGDLPAARLAFHRCLDLDPTGKWQWEIETLLKRLGPSSARQAEAPCERENTVGQSVGG